jgi:hypothetical protein
VPVVVAPETEGLGVMLAELVRANLGAHPERARYLRAPGTINLEATDAEVEVGLRFGEGSMHVGPAHAKADLSVSATSEVLLQLTNVPLRFGLPDNLTAEGRGITKLLLNGTIKVHGLARHLGLMTRLNRVFSIR